MSDEKRKRSWREIDRKRDRGSAGSSNDAPAGPRRDGRSSQRYKAMLEKAFDRGDMGAIVERLDQSSPTSTPGQASKKNAKGPGPQKLLHQVKNASERTTALDAFDQYVERYGMPNDYDVLTRALEHPKQQVLLAVMEHILHLLEESRPRRTKTLAARVRLIMEDDFEMDEDVRQKAAELAQRL